MMSIRRALTSTMVVGLMVAAFMAVAGASASPASAACLRVDEAKTGNWEFLDPATLECAGKHEAGKEFIKAKVVFHIEKDVWCAQVEEPETGNRATNECNGAIVSKGSYIEVSTPLLYIGGAVKTDGASHAVETRIKSGTTFTLESKVGTTAFTLTSNEVESTKAAVKATEPASDSAEAIVFKHVKVTAPATCTTDEVSSRTTPTGMKTPVETVSTKPVSTVFEQGGLSGIADTFTPALEEGKEVFVEIQLKAPRGSECPIPTEYYSVTGHEAGEALTPETEAEWKTLKFPVTSLSSLTFGGEPATLAGEAELRLTTKEAYTVK